MNAALLAKLISAGTPAELVAEVAVELGRAQAAMETLEERRKRDRERKSVPRNSTESEESAEIQERVFLDKEKSPIPPKEIKPFPCVKTRAKAKHPLPANWQPMPLKADGQAGMIAARKPVGWIERELSKFKDHALQNRRLCSDWDAAWRNWIKQADEFDEKRTNTLGRHQPPNDGLSSTARAAVAVFGLDARQQ
jgi:hypothetical protein